MKRLAIVLGLLLVLAGQARADVSEYWEPVTLDGFGDADNIAINSSVVYEGDLYVGTWNRAQGCAVYRVERRAVEGEPAWHGERVSNYGFSPLGDNPGNITTSQMIVFDGRLYVGTMYKNPFLARGELWRVREPHRKPAGQADWEKVPIPWIFRANCYTSMSVYTWPGEESPSLYIGLFRAFNRSLVVRSPDGFSTWKQASQKTIGWFSNPPHRCNSEATSMAVFNDRLHAGTENISPACNSYLGTEIWTMTDAPDERRWDLVNADTADGSGGFGEGYRVGTTMSMVVHHDGFPGTDYLYVGTRTKDYPFAAELWRWDGAIDRGDEGRADLADWELVDIPIDADNYAFGYHSAHSWRPEMSVEPFLFVTTYNIEGGCEVWMHNDYAGWRQINTDRFGEAAMDGCGGMANCNTKSMAAIVHRIEDEAGERDMLFVGTGSDILKHVEDPREWPLRAGQLWALNTETLFIE